MSRKRRRNGADEAYDAHLRHTPFRNKPQSDEQEKLERLMFRFMSELSVNRFRWMGLPKEIDPRFLETTLFYNGFGLFFRDFRYAKFMFTKATSSGRLDFYDNPTRFRAIATNYPSMEVFARKQATRDGKPIAGKGVPIWSNYLRMPDLDIVTVYSKRIAIADRTIDVNSENARHNKFVLSNDRNRLSFDNISRELEQGNNNIKVADRSGNPDVLENIKVLDLGINPDHIEKMHIIRTRLLNDAYSMLGIDNSNEDKKERLVSAEVDAGADKALLVRYVNLNARQEACRAINEIYGTKIWVEYNTEIDKMVGIPTFAEEGLTAEGYEVMEPVDDSENAEKEGDEDERIYDADEKSDSSSRS